MMPDREKVIKALGICAGDNDFSVCINEKCPYIGGAKDGYCITNLERDALALLQEQEHKDKMYRALESDWKRLKELLKEQEAVEPSTDEYGNKRCGNCGYKLQSIADPDLFCCKCGKPVLWEGW